MATDLTALMLLTPEGLKSVITRLQYTILVYQRERNPDPMEIAKVEQRLSLCRSLLHAARRTARFVS